MTHLHAIVGALPRLLILAAFVAAGVYTHTRGRVRLLAKRIKTWDRTAYYALKWLLLGTLAYLIFLRPIL